MINSILSSFIRWESCRNHKRSQQEVSNILLPYLYYRYIVHTSDKQSYPNVHTSAMSVPYIYYKINML